MICRCEVCARGLDTQLAPFSFLFPTSQGYKPIHSPLTMAGLPSCGPMGPRYPVLRLLLEFSAIGGRVPASMTTTAGGEQFGPARGALHFVAVRLRR